MNDLEVPRGWDESRVPLLEGKRYLITGGTSGLGRASAASLRSLGAHVTITARDVAKAESIVAAGGASDVIAMDLSDLASVRGAASRITQPYDVVILNAGVMWTPYRLTSDGFESQLGINHLGHFAFAGLIRHAIVERLVTVSSLYQRYGTFGDGSADEIRRRCLGETPYDSRSAYGDSKLANILFTYEFERRRAVNTPTFIALAAHPGWTHTDLFREVTSSRRATATIVDLSTRALAQRPARGALPQLCAATIAGVAGGEYFGPRGLGQLRGTPKIVQSVSLARDAGLAARLWSVSEELTGVQWS